MIDWIIDNLFGSWGRPLLEVAQANVVPISLIVVAYGAVLVMFNLRLKPYRIAAQAQTRSIIGTLGSAPKGPALAALVQKKFDWNAVAAVGEGRFVAGRWMLWPTRASVQSLPRMLPMTELVRASGR